MSVIRRAPIGVCILSSSPITGSRIRIFIPSVGVLYTNNIVAIISVYVNAVIGDSSANFVIRIVRIVPSVQNVICFVSVLFIFL